MDPLFEVHKLNEQGIGKAKDIAEAFDECLTKLRAYCPEGRLLSIVKTHLEEASFAAKKAMASEKANQV